MTTLWQDIRYGFRQLLKNPRLTGVIVISLALGIGGTTVIFSMINAVLLRPLPYRSPERLVYLWEQSPQHGNNRVSAPTFLDWQQQSQAFEGMALIQEDNLTLTDVEEPERLEVGRVSAGFFDLLGVSAALGRTFQASEDRPGAAPVLVLSDPLWARRFGRDPRIIGKTISLGEQSHTVIGVLPPTFFYYLSCEAFVPAAPDPAGPRDDRRFRVIARLNEEASLDQAQAEMEGIAGRLAASFPETYKDWGVSIERMHESLTRGQRQDLPILLSAAAFVLLISCANVANLLLARMAKRQHEISVRLALGAGRLRLLRQLLTESVVLAILAGAVGCLLAAWGMQAIGKAVPQSAIPTGVPLQVDLHVFGFCLLLSIVTGLVFGASPAWGASKPDLQEGLSQTMRGAGLSGGRWLRSALVVTQLALSLVLLAGALLMVQAFTRVTRLDPGVRPQDILTFEISLPPTRYSTAEKTQETCRRLLEGVGHLPGVRSAALATGLPYRGAGTVPFEIIGHAPARAGEQPRTQMVAASPDFLSTIGLGLLQGRGLKESDDSPTGLAAVVNETFVRRFLAGAEPLGTRLRLEPAVLGLEGKDPLLAEIVGVSQNSRSVSPRPNDAAPQIYLSYLQCGFRGYYVCLDSVVAPESLAASARRAVRDIDKDLPVAAVQTLAAIRGRAFAIPRVLTGVMTVFGLLALGLAVMGTYGLVAHSTALRSREMGIRMALGATRGNLLWLVLKQGMRLVIVGLLLGLAGALAISRLLQGLLFGVPTLNIASILGVCLLLLAVAFLACYFPARRAARINPMVALRYE
jgi:putative ABC transport system permease protein